MHSGIPTLQALLTAEMKMKITHLIPSLRDSTGDFLILWSRRSVLSLSSSSGGCEKNPLSRKGGGKRPYNKWRVCFQARRCPSGMATWDFGESGCFSGGMLQYCDILSACARKLQKSLRWLKDTMGQVLRTTEVQGHKKITARLGWDKKQIPYTKRASQKTREKLLGWPCTFGIDEISLSSQAGLKLETNTKLHLKNNNNIVVQL